MPKFGDATRLFNDSAYKYGVDGTNPSGEIQWIFQVDWDGDETFNYNEASYLIDLEVSRGERYFVRPGGNGFEIMRPGEGSAVLIDRNGRFDPDNASSPLYGKILPGRKFRLSVKDLGTGTIYPVMAGYINDIPPLTEYERVQLSLRESISLLDRKVSIPIIYRQSISTVMGDLINQAAFPVVFGSSIGTETQQVTTFAVDNINGLDVLLDLGAACLGQVFADNTGRIKFYGRGYSAMQTVNLDQAQCLKMIRRSQPWENLRNIIHVIANKKLKAREAAIWQTGQPIEVAASSSVTFWANIRPAIDVRVYSMKANSAINGSGTSKTASVTVALNAYSNSMEITLTNADAAAVYVWLVITGRPIVDQPMRTVVQNALSTADYGEMSFELDNPYLQDHNHASQFATMISNFLDEPQRTIEVQIEQRPSLQFAFDLLDKIAFTSSKLSISATYYAGLIEHRWSAETGQAVTTTLVMRPRLTDATSISNDPEDPDLPYIPEPELPPGGWIPIDTPTAPPIPDGSPNPDQNNSCLSDPDAPSTGPYNLIVQSGAIQSNASYFFQVDVPSTIYARPATHTNKTKVALTGKWQKWNASLGTWELTTDSGWWNIRINSTNLTHGTYSDDGSGTRVLTYDLGGAFEIDLITVELVTTTPSGYSYGPIVASGTVSATDDVGASVSLTIGNYYAIEGSGGPWSASPTLHDIYMIGLRATGGTQVYIGWDGSLAGAWKQDGGLAYEEDYSAYYGRAYFQFSGLSPKVLVPDNNWLGPWGDNSGTMGYIIRNAYYNTIYRLVIDQLAIYNYCV